ncbi:MAG: short-chain dehydrogenase [Gallionellales bacterium GWA2_60_18]|nr:MAG: short-chain dehydrogenase [Gallionellales bacterium GWA2_60_18]
MSISQRWTVFTAAPHRVMFFGGTLQAIAVMLWWLLELTTRYGIAGQPVDWPIAPAAIHGWLMVYGLFPMFMFGFLMTTFPRWMNGREIPARRYVPAFVSMMLGVAGFYAGLLLGHGVLLVAVLGMLAGWGMALYALLRVLRDTRHPDKQHPQMLFVALCLGWCGLAAYATWLSGADAIWLRLAIDGGMWLFLLPVFASVAHRMLPFFTNSALQGPLVPRPLWTWWVMLAGSAAHGLLQLAGAGAWLWLADLPLAFAALYLTHVWRLRRSLRVPLLAVLHIGFAWLGIAMLLFAAQSLALLVGGQHIWGLAPLHALTIGCFATLLIGMGTRVTLGHSGMPMQVDGAVKLMFAGIQLVALLRVLADVLPIQLGIGVYLAAALVWLACFIAWGWRYLPLYWRLRADGQPG